MALSAADMALLRSSLRDVTTLAQRDLLAAWREFDFSDAGRVKDDLIDVLRSLIGGYHLTSATVASDWYDLVRAESGVGGSFTAIVPDGPTPGAAEALAGWAIGPLYGGSGPETALSNAAGGLQRVVKNGGRDAVRLSAIADPGADGWQRQASSTGCPFCRMLAGRGAVYSEEGVDFAAHDHCNCDAVPAFGGQPRPVKAYTVSPRRTIDPETGKPVIDADYKRARQWMRDNGYLT